MLTYHHQWFEHSWSHPHFMQLVESIYSQACIHARGYDWDSMVVREVDVTWENKAVQEGMKKWVAEMNTEAFHKGSVVDRSVWTYSVYMLKGYSKHVRGDWLTKAVNNTEKWLQAAM